MKCNVKNVDINYKIIGDGKPIIMIHGYAADQILMSSCMEPIFNINSNFKRIYMDLPGMGDSQSADWINSSDKILDVIIEFIEQVIPNENFLLVGQSYGGYLARGILYKMMTKVDGLLLICPVIIADKLKRNTPQKITLVKDKKLLLKMSSKEAENFNSAIVVQNENTYERYKNEVLAGIKKADVDFLRRIKKNGYSFSFDVSELKEKYLKPILMIMGKQDSIVGYKDSWETLKDFPRATFAILDKSGHNLQIEQKKIFECLVIEWLERINEID